MKVQVQRLLALAATAELFRAPCGDAYATVSVNGHSENWPIENTQFLQWLSHRYYVDAKSAPRKQAVREVVNTLAARARFDGIVHPVHLRVAEHGGRIYLDLADDGWQVVEIDVDGWRAVTPSPVKFRRVRGMQPLPVPERGGTIADLRPFVNLGNDDDWHLLVGWTVAAFRPRGPYPLAAFLGEQGSAKTTTARVLRSLIDPNIAELRAEPRDVRDLMIAANNGWVLSFDNLSHLPAWLSDGLCRLATGGAFAARELYSDAQETLFEAQRPIILTGIGELATRGDLLDRCLHLELPPISPEDRRPEHEFWRDFYAVRPLVLGAFLDAVSGALRCLPTTTLAHHPRMADCAAWVSAAEPSLGWAPGTFLAAYDHNRASANEVALEASPISAPLFALLMKGAWEGSASSLLRALAYEAGESATKQRSWPKNPRILADMLRRVAPNLRAAGVALTFWKAPDRRRTRMIGIEISASASSTSSAEDLPAPSAAMMDGDDAFLATLIASSEGERVQTEPANRRPFDELSAEMRDIVKKAKESGDLRVAIAGLRELAKLLSLQDRGAGHSSAVNPSQFREVDDDKLDRLIRRLLPALGFQAPTENDARCGNVRATTPPGDK